MKYSPERERTISGLRRVSKPGLRVYTKADKVPRVLGGLGVAVLSTSRGLLTDRDARRAGIGGAASKRRPGGDHLPRSRRANQRDRRWRRRRLSGRGRAVRQGHGAADAVD